MHGVDIKNEVTIDWYELGLSLSEVSSDDQGDLLRGLAHGLYENGTMVAQTQLLHIADDIRGGQATTLIRDLMGFIEGEDL